MSNFFFIHSVGVIPWRILENLYYLDGQGAKIEVRIPFVPGYNDGEMEAIGKVLSSLQNLVKVRLLPYHDYAGSKYAALLMENTLPATVPTDEQMHSAAQALKMALGGHGDKLIFPL